MVKSMTHSLSNAHSEDGHAMAHAKAQAKALNTPGTQKTFADTKTKTQAVGDADATADAGASAEILEDGSMSAETFGETSATVE
jgi:hypothetical protein